MERARKKRIPFAITREWIEERVARGTCQATGLPFDLSPGRGQEGRAFSPSLDQKMPGMGYTPENTQVVVFIHNSARGTWGDGVLHHYARAFLKSIGDA